MAASDKSKGGSGSTATIETEGQTNQTILSGNDTRSGEGSASSGKRGRPKGSRNKANTGFTQPTASATGEAQASVLQEKINPPKQKSKKKVFQTENDARQMVLNAMKIAEATLEPKIGQSAKFSDIERLAIVTYAPEYLSGLTESTATNILKYVAPIAVLGALISYSYRVVSTVVEIEQEKTLKPKKETTQPNETTTAEVNIGDVYPNGEKLDWKQTSANPFPDNVRL